MLQKLAGGWPLSCGHRQHLSDDILRKISGGQWARRVYCMECDEFVSVLPVKVEPTSVDEPEEKEGNQD